MDDRQIFTILWPAAKRSARRRLFVLLNFLTAALIATIRVLPAQPPLPVTLEHGAAQRRRGLPARAAQSAWTKLSANFLAFALNPRQVGPRKQLPPRRQ
jgi:hypothetical protein